MLGPGGLLHTCRCDFIRVVTQYQNGRLDRPLGDVIQQDRHHDIRLSQIRIHIRDVQMGPLGLDKHLTGILYGRCRCGLKSCGRITIHNHAAMYQAHEGSIRRYCVPRYGEIDRRHLVAVSELHAVRQHQRDLHRIACDDISKCRVGEIRDQSHRVPGDT